MLSNKIQEALNDHLNAELYSSYFYLAMSAHLGSRNLNGCANWMRVQAREELEHAMKCFDYLNNQGGKVTLTAIEQPPTDWDSPLAVFEDAFRHEQKVTERINGLCGVAIGEQDHATGIFLQWFVTEQIEEEATFNDILHKLRLIGDDPGGLFMLDMELGKRGAA